MRTKDQTTTVWNAIKTAVETVVNAIKTVITTAWNAIKTTTSTIFNAVKSVVTSVWNGIKSAVMNVVNTMKSGISNGFNAIKSTVSNIVNGIKSTISNVFNTIWSTVSGIVNKLKSVFNFSWSLPKIKLPHFSITGSFSLNPPSIPHFSVDWYKKAMSGGMILKDATIFGQSGGTLLGGGEAGDEAVVGVSSLRSMIQDAVSSATLSVSGDQPLINIEEMSVRSDDDTFKRRIHSCTGYKYTAWCCSTHIKDKDKCHMLFVKDDDLKQAFVTMMNKLVYAHRIILKPYVDALKNTSSDDSLRRIQEIQTLLAQNTEKRETLTKLMTQGIIDPILFNKETNELLSQADSFRDEINALKNAVSGDVTKVTAATALLHFTEKGGILQEFDDDLFNEYVNRIIVRSRNEVRFELKCGLTLRERM